MKSELKTAKELLENSEKVCKHSFCSARVARAENQLLDMEFL